MSPQEKRFTFNHFSYAAKLWGQAGQLPVIALHGWLDNSASFDVLAPLLKGVQCLAIDLAGHGLSDHRDGLVDYPLWSEIATVYAIADEMGWQHFALLGHSRGAMMALLTAGVYPHRISHVVMLDGLLPPLVDAQSAPERMVVSIENIQVRLQRKLSLYQTYEAAITARSQSRFAHIEPSTAELLAVRGLREVKDQYHWHADGKLWAPSNVALSAEMVDAFVHKITAPSQLLLAKQGLMAENKTTTVSLHAQRVIETIGADVQWFEGGHFLHMEGQVAPVAEAVESFLLS